MPPVRGGEDRDAGQERPCGLVTSRNLACGREPGSRAPDHDLALRFVAICPGEPSDCDTLLRARPFILEKKKYRSRESASSCTLKSPTPLTKNTLCVAQV